MCTHLHVYTYMCRHIRTYSKPSFNVVDRFLETETSGETTCNETGELNLVVEGRSGCDSGFIALGFLNHSEVVDFITYLIKAL